MFISLRQAISRNLWFLFERRLSLAIDRTPSHTSAKFKRVQLTFSLTIRQNPLVNNNYVYLPTSKCCLLKFLKFRWVNTKFLQNLSNYWIHCIGTCFNLVKMLKELYNDRAHMTATTCAPLPAPKRACRTGGRRATLAKQFRPCHKLQTGSL